jgi:DNA primase
MSSGEQHLTTRTTDLATLLEDLGVDVYRTHGDEINAKCPVHYKSKGRESTRNSWYMNVDSGLWHCFTCGARGNLPMLLSELAADPGTLWNAQSYIITQGLRRLTDDEREDYVEPEPEVDWIRYAKFAALPERVLALRNLDAEVANRFGVKWDKEEKLYITPIVSQLGELRGWQAKKSSYVKNTPFGVNKSLTLFGIERAFGTTALLLESPLDVVRFHSVYGGSDINALSSFGANVSAEQIKLLVSKFDHLILALDNDKAGRAETKRLVPLLPRRGTRYWKYTPDDPKDIGEMNDGQIIKGLGNVSSLHV